MPKSKATECFLISNIVYLICQKFEDVNDAISLLTIVESLSLDTYYTVLKCQLFYRVTLPDPYCFSRNCFQNLRKAIQYHKASNWVFSSIEFDLSDRCVYCNRMPRLCREKNVSKTSLPKLEDEPNFIINPSKEEAEKFISKYDELYSVIFFDAYLKDSQIQTLTLYINNQEVIAEMDSFTDSFKDLYLFLRKEAHKKTSARRITAQPNHFLRNFWRPVVRRERQEPIVHIEERSPDEDGFLIRRVYSLLDEINVEFCYSYERENTSLNSFYFDFFHDFEEEEEEEEDDMFDELIR